MELLRVADNVIAGTDLVSQSFEISGNYENSDFVIITTNLNDLSVTAEEIVASDEEVINFDFSSKYDNSYRVQVYSEDDQADIYDETIVVVRPYTNPNNLGTTATEIAEAKNHEELSRAIIDSVVPQGFYYKKVTMETVGLGADYIPLWINAKKILQVYENNILIYDSSSPADYVRNFEITADKTAITETYSGTLNRFEGARNILPAGGTDILDLNFTLIGAFPNGYDYKFVLEAGYTSVPSDIERAAKLLIDDISCGKLEYYKRYISAYNTDQYKIQFDKMIFEGTGNILVDKILSKYVRSISRLGVL